MHARLPNAGGFGNPRHSMLGSLRYGSPRNSAIHSLGRSFLGSRRLDRRRPVSSRNGDRTLSRGRWRDRAGIRVESLHGLIEVGRSLNHVVGQDGVQLLHLLHQWLDAAIKIPGPLLEDAQFMLGLVKVAPGAAD